MNGYILGNILLDHVLSKALKMLVSTISSLSKSRLSLRIASDVEFIKSFKEDDGSISSELSFMNVFKRENIAAVSVFIKLFDSDRIEKTKTNKSHKANAHR